MKLKLPVFVAQHPAESLVAAFLLLGLLFISADGSSRSLSSNGVRVAAERN
jgi:hypothetical protein